MLSAKLFFFQLCLCIFTMETLHAQASGAIFLLPERFSRIDVSGNTQFCDKSYRPEKFQFDEQSNLSEFSLKQNDLGLVVFNCEAKFCSFEEDGRALTVQILSEDKFYLSHSKGDQSCSGFYKVKVNEPDTSPSNDCRAKPGYDDCSQAKISYRCEPAARSGGSYNYTVFYTEAQECQNFDGCGNYQGNFVRVINEWSRTSLACG